MPPVDNDDIEVKVEGLEPSQSRESLQKKKKKQKKMFVSKSNFLTHSAIEFFKEENYDGSSDEDS